MNRADFKPCKLCGKGVMHTGLPIFYRVMIQRMAVDLAAVRRQSGLEMMVGGHAAIADALSTERSFADPIPGIEEVSVLICEECSLKPAMIAVLASDE